MEGAHKIYTEAELTEMAKRAVEKEMELEPRGIPRETWPFKPNYRY